MPNSDKSSKNATVTGTPRILKDISSNIWSFRPTFWGFLVDIDSLERIDANRSQKLGQNDANWGRKSLKWCKFWLEITKNLAQMMQIGPNYAAMSA